MKKALFLVCIILLIPNLLRGQQVKGRIVSEESSEPIPLATIHVCRPDSSVFRSFTAGSKGVFSEKIDLEEYVLVIGSIGFCERRVELKNQGKSDIDLGDILLPEEIVAIGEVTVIPDRVIEHVDRTIAIPSAQQYQASVNAIDLLANLQLAGLFVDQLNQTASIAGTSEVVYKINGITATIQEIRALKAEQVLRVEYSRTPSGRELWNDAGVINYILKREHIGTFLSAYALGAATTGFVNASATAKTVFEKSELTLNYQVNYRDYTQRWADADYTYHFPDGPVRLFQRGEYAPFGYTNHQIDLGYVYRTSRDIFSVKFQNSLFNSFDKTKMNMYGEETLSDLLYTRDVHSKTNSYTPTLDLYYIHNIEKDKGIEMNLVGSMTDNKYRRALDDSYPSEENYHIYNKTTEDRKALIFEAYYYNNKNSKFSYDAGIRSSNSFTTNIQNDDRAKFTRIDVNPYLTLKGKLNHFSYQLSTGLKVQSFKNDDDSKTYVRNASTLTLTYNKSPKWNVRNTVRYNTYMPSLSQMKDRDLRQNDLLVVRGNSNLKPYESLSEKITFTYTPVKKFRNETSFFFSKTFDPIHAHYFYDDGVASMVQQQINQTYNRRMTLSTYFQLSSLWNFLTASAGCEWNRYDTKGEGYELDRDDFTWQIHLTAVYKKFSLQGGYRKPGRGLYGQSIYLNENYSSVGLNYKHKNLSAGISVFYPFELGTKYRTELLARNYQYDSKTKIKDNGNMLCFQLSYSFSSGKSIFNVRKRLQNADTESTILRVGDH